MFERNECETLRSNTEPREPCYRAEIGGIEEGDRDQTAWRRLGERIGRRRWCWPVLVSGWQEIAESDGTMTTATKIVERSVAMSKVCV